VTGALQKQKAVIISGDVKGCGSTDCKEAE